MPSNSKCRLCGGDVFNADISSGIITCVRCGQQYSMGAGKKEQPQPQPQRTSPMTDTSSPSDFKIAFGVLKKYTGNSKHVVIPEGVTEIHRAFLNPSIESVVLPKSLKVIGNHAFYDTSIKHINIPYGVTTIGFCAFAGCMQLESVILPNSLTTIESMAFYQCSSLESISIPDSVIKIHCVTYSMNTNPFYGCAMLTQVSYPSRFSPLIFYGSAWYEHIGKAQYEREERDRKIANGICPDCGGKIGMFNKCKRCGKKY